METRTFPVMAVKIINTGKCEKAWKEMVFSSVCLLAIVFPFRLLADASPIAQESFN